MCWDMGLAEKESKLHQLEKALCPPRLPRLQREEQILAMTQEPGALQISFMSDCQMGGWSVE